MSNIEIVKRVYEAFVSHDLDALLAEAATDCVITQDPALPWGGRHVGHDGVATFAAVLVGTVDSHLEVDGLFEADGQVIQTGRSRGVVRANGCAFDLPETHTWTIVDGQVGAAHFASDTAAMLQAIGSAG